eukprot:CAMPEP_0181213918 /NCGR_PEP_ID=MMETSP1096-20121128/25167_1 /TAXON_ID=156174 ORGANISM="Chrysochromulina ericina, Strain CCMP281" /NCGR_SAMPLE_ID=MMETSP1096 /ASSEMBLY_ACC=CAM_ASM_000453 /LENGTH=57 /DNA_ID=CAMNT_0023305601 /DNA_START=127 /DNA_END=300 /DNA_ORIENTATION=+
MGSGCSPSACAVSLDAARWRESRSRTAGRSNGSKAFTLQLQQAEAPAAVAPACVVCT